MPVVIEDAIGLNPAVRLHVYMFVSLDVIVPSDTWTEATANQWP